MVREKVAGIAATPSPDEEVFDVSVREHRALVTLDHDLGQVLRFPPATSSGIIVLELGPRSSHRALLERARELLSIVEIRSPDRSLGIVEPGRLRIHVTDDDG
jgi:predicted nuclease of predicted toxin-antitoxin system